MNRPVMLVLSAALLLSSASAVTATENHMSQNGKASRPESSMSKRTVGSATARDDLRLSSNQRRTLWTDIDRQASKETAPAGFNGNVGDTVPGTLRTQPLPAKAASDVPAAKPYNYAMLQDKLVLLNPTDHKVVATVVQ